MEATRIPLKFDRFLEANLIKKLSSKGINIHAIYIFDYRAVGSKISR